jgi:26S proteasome regulatory subunit T2
MSFVDKDQMEPGATILLNHRNMAIVGLMQDDVDPLLNVMRV